MNESIYNHIGSHMIKSFLTYAPLCAELHLYAENITSNITDKIKIFDWNVSCKENWTNFKSTSTKDRKFAKKGFAFIHAMETADCEYLIWVDSDILFLKSFTEELIKSTLPNKKLIGIFDHSYIETGYSAESGYVILNCNHKEYNNFVELYKKYYFADTKPDEITNWWDGQICMLAASQFHNYVYNLSDLRTEDTHTPLNTSPLSEYFIHCKGKKKQYLEQAKIKNKIGL